MKRKERAKPSEVISSDALIDKFVAHVNAAPREPLDEYEMPLSVRIGAADEGGQCDWNIKPYDVTWVPELEAKLPAPFPPSFKSLIARYIFPQFEFGPLHLLGNSPDGVPMQWWELRTGIFQDKYLSADLLEAGFVQFARAPDLNYDAICFDTRAQTSDGEYPVVQVDHESILTDSDLRVTAVIAPSFAEWLQHLKL